MREELIHLLAACAIILSSITFIVSLSLFFAARRKVLKYLFSAFTTELEGWGLAANHQLTRYARWGAINEYAEKTANKELIRKLYRFRTAQLFAGDTAVVTITLAVLFLWVFNPF